MLGSVCRLSVMFLLFFLVLLPRYFNYCNFVIIIKIRARPPTLKTASLLCPFSFLLKLYNRLANFLKYPNIHRLTLLGVFIGFEFDLLISVGRFSIFLIYDIFFHLFISLHLIVNFLRRGIEQFQDHPQILNAVCIDFNILIYI